MKTTIICLAILLSFSGVLIAQEALEKPFYVIEYIGSEFTGNPNAYLKDIHVIIVVDDITQISTVRIFGGSAKGTADKYTKTFQLSDKSLYTSKTLNKLDDNKILVKLGYEDRKKEMIHLQIQVEDINGNLLRGLHREFTYL